MSNLRKQQELSGHRVVILTSNCDEITRSKHVYQFGLRDTPAALDNITLRRLVSLVMLFFKAFCVLTKERPDIIHTHSIDMAFFVSYAAHFYRIPLVHTFHIVTFYDKNQPLIRRKSELLLAKGARLQAITVPNQHDALLLQAAGFKQAVLLPNGIDLKFWQKLRNEACEKEFVFLAVGRLEEQKGYTYLLKAAALLATDAMSPPFRIIIVGEGVQYEHLVELANRLGIADYIKFVGRKTPREVRVLLSQSNAFVLPSLYETTPLTLLEAWAAHVPVVASRVGILRDNPRPEAAYVVTPQDERCLMRAMQQCMADTSGRLTTADRGSRAAQQYTWSRITETADMIYGSLV